MIGLGFWCSMISWFHSQVSGIIERNTRGACNVQMCMMENLNRVMLTFLAATYRVILHTPTWSWTSLLKHTLDLPIRALRKCTKWRASFRAINPGNIFGTDIYNSVPWQSYSQPPLTRRPDRGHRYLNTHLTSHFAHFVKARNEELHFVQLTLATYSVLISIIR